MTHPARAPDEEIAHAQQWEIDLVASHDHVPRVLPSTWSPLRRQPGWYRHTSGMTACLSAQRHPEHGVWLHLSVSRGGRVPSWEDLLAAKHVFMGPQRACVQVFPSVRKYINQCTTALHLWSRVDAEDGDEVPLPDFRIWHPRVGMTI